MQTNYAALHKREFIEHVKYDKEDFDPEKGKKQALAENYLLHVGVCNRLIKVKGRDHVYLSELLVAFNEFEKSRIGDSCVK